MEIQWKRLGIEDEELINSFYCREPVRNCEFTFANNLLWEPFYKIRYAVVEDMLVFLSEDEKWSVSCPVGGANLKKCVDTLTEYFYRIERPFRMHLVSPVQFEKLEAMYPGRFKVEYDRAAADYVYESGQLISLAGKKLHGKRNHINRFKENYPDWSYERINADNAEECMEMAEAWKVHNGCPDKGAKHNEFCVTMNALKYMKELRLRGGLLRAGKRVVAFSIGEPCGEDMFVVHIEKAFADVQGAYPMINQQFVIHEAAEYKYINREEDAGEEGLRKAKLSYCPAFLMEKGIVTEIGN